MYDKEKRRKRYLKDKLNPKYCEKKNLYMKEYMDRDREAWNLRTRENYRKNKEQLNEERWQALLIKRYGINVEEYNNMLLQQNNKCAICETENFNNKKNKKWHVDHDHITGKVRGLLCQSCNIALGLLKDNETLLQKALNYLINNKKETIPQNDQKTSLLQQ